MFLKEKSICRSVELRFLKKIFALFGETSKTPYIRQRNNCLTNI